MGDTLNEIEARAKRMLRYHERTETDYSIAAQVDRDALALVGRVREVQREVEQLTVRNHELEEALKGLLRVAVVQERDLGALTVANSALAASGEEQEMSGERTLLDEWVALFASRDELAVEYASLLRANGAEWKDWPALNLAILDRWSEAGLRYVKQKARKEASDAG